MESTLRPYSAPHTLALPQLTRPQYAVTLKDPVEGEVVLADPKVARIFLAIMDAHAVNGGAACHWGGPSALMEILSCLHTMMFSQAKQKNLPWPELFHLVNDIGHAENAFYTMKALWQVGGLTFDDLTKFRSINSPLTGHGEAHLYPEGVLVSNGPLGSAIGQAQGLCLGDKIKNNHRTTFCFISDGGMMEGEAKEVLASLPGLAQKKKMNPFVLIISDNNTKLSGRIDEDSFSMNPTFSSLETLGWKLQKNLDGHDLKSVYQALISAQAEAVKDPTRPIALHFKTIKGYGVKSTSESKSGGHGYPLKKHDPQIQAFIQEIYQAELPVEFSTWAAATLTPAKAASSAAVSPASPEAFSAKDLSEWQALNLGAKEKIQEGVGKALIRAVEQDKLPVFSISADLQGSTGLANFHKKFPQHVLDIGVAESNMISVAGGLSKNGFIPIVDTFAQFGITKGLLPLTMGLLSESPCIGIFSHTGFQDAADGASHQATTYLSATSALPYTWTIQCGTSEEMDAYLTQALHRFAQQQKQTTHTARETFLFFLGRENFPANFRASLRHEWGKAQVLFQAENPNVVIASSGSLTHKALRALPALNQAGIHPIVVHAPFANHPDVQTLLPLLEKCQGRLVTYEDHQVIGGFGQQLTSALTQEKGKFALRCKVMGIKGHFGRSAYSAEELYEHFGLGEKDLVKTCQELL